MMMMMANSLFCFNWKWWIGHFRVPRCKTFLLKMSFICMRIKTNFNINPKMASLQQFSSANYINWLSNFSLQNQTVAILRPVKINKRQNISRSLLSILFLHAQEFDNITYTKNSIILRVLNHNCNIVEQYSLTKIRLAK